MAIDIVFGSGAVIFAAVNLVALGRLIQRVATIEKEVELTRISLSNGITQRIRSLENRLASMIGDHK